MKKNKTHYWKLNVLILSLLITAILPSYVFAQATCGQNNQPGTCSSGMTCVKIMIGSTARHACVPSSAVQQVSQASTTVQTSQGLPDLIVEKVEFADSKGNIFQQNSLPTDFSVTKASFTIKNIGKGPTKGESVEYRMFVAGSGDVYDILTQPINLKPGESSTVAFSRVPKYKNALGYYLTSVNAGLRNVKLIADFNNVVKELNEQNNEKTFPLSAGHKKIEGDLPDLTVSSIEVEQDGVITPTENLAKDVQITAIYATFKNIGTKASPEKTTQTGTPLRFPQVGITIGNTFMNAGDLLSDPQNPLVSGIQKATLQPGESVRLKFRPLTRELFLEALKKNPSITATINSASKRFDESNLGNNEKTITVSFVEKASPGVGRPKPDLIIEKIEIRQGSVLIPLSSFDLKQENVLVNALVATVKNIGNAPAEGIPSIPIMVEFSVNGEGIGGGSLINVQLKPGESKQIETSGLDFKNSINKFSNPELKVVVDKTDLIEESNEKNNELIVQIKFKIAELPKLKETAVGSVKLSDSELKKILADNINEFSSIKQNQGLLFAIQNFGSQMTRAQFPIQTAQIKATYASDNDLINLLFRFYKNFESKMSSTIVDNYKKSMNNAVTDYLLNVYRATNVPKSTLEMQNKDVDEAVRVFNNMRTIFGKPKVSIQQTTISGPAVGGLPPLGRLLPSQRGEVLYLGPPFEASIPELPRSTTLSCNLDEDIVSSKCIFVDCPHTTIKDAREANIGVKSKTSSDGQECVTQNGPFASLEVSFPSSYMAKCGIVMPEFASISRPGFGVKFTLDCKKPEAPPTEGPTPIEPPSFEPPTEPPSEPPYEPPSEPPIEPPFEPPSEPPTEPPFEPPIEPPVEPPFEPPSEPPSEPPIEPPVDEPPSEPPTSPLEPPSEPSSPGEPTTPLVGPPSPTSPGVDKPKIVETPEEAEIREYLKDMEKVFNELKRLIELKERKDLLPKLEELRKLNLELKRLYDKKMIKEAYELLTTKIYPLGASIESALAEETIPEQIDRLLKQLPLRIEKAKKVLADLKRDKQDITSANNLLNIVIKQVSEAKENVKNKKYDEADKKLNSARGVGKSFENEVKKLIFKVYSGGEGIF